MVTKKLYNIVLLLLFVVLPIHLNSQEKYAEWKTIDTGIGLAFKCAAEDSSGNIWLGSMRGPVKFDGEKFLHFDNPPYKINTILADTSGTLWFGTNKGLYMYDGNDMQLIENDYLNFNSRIKHLALDIDGSIWISSGPGLRHFKNNELLIYQGENPWEDLSDVETWGLYVDSKGNKWIGVNSLFKVYSIVKYDNSNWVGFHDSEGFLAMLALSFVEDMDGNIWICGEGYDNATYGMYVYNGENIQKVGPYYQPDHCNIDKEGYLWFAGYGLLLYRNGQWEHFTKGNTNLCHDLYQFILVDTKGNRWFLGCDIEGVKLTLLTSGEIQSSTTNIKSDTKKKSNSKLSISPNPANLQSTIKYNVPVKGRISIEIYNILGQKVITLLPETEKFPGEYHIRWDGKDQSGATVPSGVYFCLYSYSDRNIVAKFTVLK